MPWICRCIRGGCVDILSGVPDPYERFARFYDRWQAGYPRPFAEAILPFYEGEILRRGVPARSLADLACGTGAFLCEWARRHGDWRILGTDRSGEMLAIARSKLRDRESAARLLHQPLERIALPAPVGAAVCVFDSVNHVTRIADLRRFFRGTFRCILPGGLFLFDLNDERRFARLFEGTWTVESDGLFVSTTGWTDGAGRRGRMRFTIFERLGRSWTRTEFSIEERNWRREEIERVLAEAGFLLLRVRRIDPFPPALVEAPRTLWICRRQ